jgi:hypothetical protein
MKSTKTKKVKKINEKTVIAALDIGKNGDVMGDVAM